MSINDEDLLLKLGNYQFGAGPDFAAMEVIYHHQCKTMEAMINVQWR